MPKNLAHRYSTVSNMRWYGHQCYNFFLILFTFLSPPNTSLSVCNTALSLSPLSSLVSISPLLPISFSVSFFLSLHLFVSAPLSLSFFYWEGDSDLKQSSPIEARQSEPLLVDLKLCSPRGSRRSLLVILHSSCRRSRRWWLVEFSHWLICWVGVLLKILSFFFFFFGWGFWIWNLLKDSVIVVVVCGGGCWFLGGGDCH